MSIASEITRLLNAKVDIKTAIENKGVTVPNDETLDQYSTYIDDISVGSSDEEKDVIYIDYDGTIVAQYTAAEFALLDSHPANPDHTAEGLTAQGWNWNLADAKTQVAAAGFLTIGLDYITSDGYTRYVIDTTDWTDQVTPIRIKQSKANGTKINWGDGSADETINGNANALVTITHTYATPGIYTITLKPDSDCNLDIGSGTYQSIFGYWYNYLHLLKTLSGIVEIHIGRTSATLIPRIGSFKLKCVTIPRGITGAVINFFDNSGVKSLTLPKGFTTLATCQYCSNLKYLSLPKEVNDIPASAFQYCWSLEKISIPPSVTSIKGSIFQYCSSLKKVYIPSTVTEINDSAFRGVYSLELVNIPNTTSIGKNVFLYCFKLQNLILPNNITLDSQCFAYCYSLKTLTLPSTITIIPNNAFLSCYSLTSITIPNTVTEIQTSAFNGCLSLEEINIPNSVTTLGLSAFANAVKLKKLYIGTGITSIGATAFASSNNSVLEGIWIYATSPPTITSSTWNNTNNCPIYVPQGSLTAYLTALNWSANSIKNRLLEM